MDKLIEQGYKVIRYPISGYWLDIGQHDELARARDDGETFEINLKYNIQ